MTFIEILRVIEEIGVALFLAYAAYSDYKTRIIEDKVWGLMLLTLAPITLYLISSVYERFMPLYMASLLIGIMLGMFIGLTKLTGGADAKAVMVISAVVIPKGFSPLLIPSLTIMLNSTIFSLLTIIYVLLRNLLMYAKSRKLFNEELPMTTKIMLILVAYRERVCNIISHPYRYFIVEVIEGGTKHYRLALLSAEEDTSETIKKMISQGVKDTDYLWVSPSIPLIVYVLMGYLYYITYGNVLEPLLVHVFKRL